MVRDGQVEWLDEHVPTESIGPWKHALERAMAHPTLHEQSLLSQKYIDLAEDYAERQRDMATSAALTKEGHVVMLRTDLMDIVVDPGDG
jgi:hypothetical protein